MAGDYTLDQIKAMQNEATRRVREMNERSRNIAESKRTNQQNFCTDQKDNYLKQQISPENEPVSQTKKKSPFGLNFLKSLDFKSLIGENSEQTILLLLILLLMNEQNPDELLIFALIYIML